MRVVAFIRGINVGGKHKLPMAELRAEVERAGYEGVSTYIQSGNVLFTHEGALEPLHEKLEDLIEAKFGFRPTVILRSKSELEAILEKAPFEASDDDYSHQFVALFRRPIEGDLPADAPNGSCKYFLKTDREIYSQWFQVDGKWEIPNGPKHLAIGTVRNRRVLTTLLEKL